ncbi:ABC transporter ATP-binding protein/permease [Flavobacteriaceae bacterium]|nr:ABC transporter ATP-binding protein/permease [Flavobacteriaceae bacterium]
MDNTLQKVKSLLDSRDKVYISLLSFFTFIGLLLEVVGLAIIIPIISLTISSNEADINFLNIDFNILANHFGFSSVIVFLLASLLIVFFIKSLFFIALYYHQKTFVSNLINKISDNLFYSYSNQNLNYYTQKNRSSIIQNLQNETYYLFLFFESLTVLVSEALLVVFLLLFTFVFDSSGLLFIVIYFGLATLVYSSFTRKKSIEWGDKRLSLDQEISKTILETFGYIKEILINNSQLFFNKKFKDLNKHKFKFFSYRLTLDQIPKVYFEFITVVFIIFYTYYLNSSNISTQEIITRIGILVAISYKVMPSLSKISSSYQTIKNTSSSLNKIFNEITNSKVKDDQRNIIIKFKQSIFLRDISYAYPETNKLIFENLNLKINKNEIIGIIGKSGKGKTTLLDIISGLLKEFNGKIIIDDKELDLKSNYWKPKVSYVSQSTFIFDDTIKNNICISSPDKELNRTLFETSIRMASLDDWINSLDLKEETVLSQDGVSISGGQKQRIGIARAIYNDSDLLLFDEPTSSLDSKTEKEIMNTIYGLKGNKTVIIVTHKTETLNKCDKIIEL